MPLSHTKALAEQEVLGANDKQLTTCALRPHLIWGPRDQHLIPRLIARARAGQLRRVGDGANRIDMTFVENAAAAHWMAGDRLQPESPVAGRAYFISQGEPVRCWEWIDQLLALAGLPKVSKSVTVPTAYRAGAALEFVYRALRLSNEPRMTRFLASQLGYSHYFNIERAREDFGYYPIVTTMDGMRRLQQSMAQGTT